MLATAFHNVLITTSKHFSNDLRDSSFTFLQLRTSH